MKRLSLSLAVVILALSSAVSASDFEEDKQYISCRKGAVNDRQLTACQERLLERLDMSIAKALDRNMTLLAESERITAQRYQSQWESWRQSHCDYSLRKQNDQQRDRLDVGQAAHGLLAYDQQCTHQSAEHKLPHTAARITSCR